MKFFVTDAQLAAIRATATEAAWEDCRRGLGTLATHHDAEITRLRADRDAELARLADPHAPFIAHLEAEVELWRLLYTAERQRNDVATDRRLAEHGLGGITGPTQSLTPPAEMPGSLEELLRTTELGAMGRADGVER